MRNKRKAASAVEFAVILPFLALFLLGAVDFSRFARIDISVEAAAGAGARKGASTPVTLGTTSRWEDSIREAVTDEMEGLYDFDPDDLEVTITRTVESDGTWTVEVVVEYVFRTVLKWPGISRETILASTAKNQGHHP